MKHIRQTVWPILALVLLLLVGCASEADSYPVMTPATLDVTALEVAEGDELRFSFPTSGWTADDSYEIPVIVFEESNDGTPPLTVSAQIIGRFSGKLSNKYRDDLAEAMEGQVSAMTLDLLEMRTLRGEGVLYCESTGLFTDEILDAMLEAGTVTQDQIDQQGGREALLAIPTTYYITVYAVKDRHLVLYTGTYYAASQKQLVLDAMTTAIATSAVI